MILSMRNIKKFYGKFCALDGLNLEIEEGALYGFVGPNGAGKTTAIKIMTGIMYPDEGSVIIDGMETGTDNRRLKKKIGYVPDSFGVYNNLTVSEYMSFFASCYGIDGLRAEKRITRLLQYMGIEDKADFYIEALSRGMKQKLSLARALIHDPKLLIMDEPTLGLDPRTRFEYKQKLSELSELGKTILISSHILTEISEMCTDIGIIDQGSMVMSGRLTDVMKMVTSQNPIIVTLSSKITQAIKLLKEEKNVKSMSIKGNDLLINFEGSRKNEAELLAKMIDAGLPVVSFSREKGSLESIFIQLTGHDEERTVLSYENQSDL